MIRQFRAGQQITAIDVALDEMHLVAATTAGGIGVWEIGSGKKLWWHSGMDHFYDASFGQNGKTVIACDYFGKIFIFESRSGDKIKQFGSDRGAILSATLSVDGSIAAFFDVGGNLFTLDVRSDEAKKLDVKGFWPVRFSADGKSLAYWEVSTRFFCVLNLGKKTPKEFGRFREPGHVRPTMDNHFLVTGQTEEGVCGFEYAPITEQFQKVWLNTTSAALATDFDPGTMIGVSTTHTLRTSLLDLRTGDPLLRIDNSANYRPTVIAWSSGGVGWILVACVAVVVFPVLVLTLAWAIKTARRGRRIMSTPITDSLVTWNPPRYPGPSADS